MTPAPGAGSEVPKKKRKRKRPTHRSPQNSPASDEGALRNTEKSRFPKPLYAKRVDEVSAGGLVVDSTGKLGLLIGRRDLKDATGKRILWSLPKGHIEEGESPEEAALREVAEETGIQSAIVKSLGVIDFWFMAGGKRIHKTVHHFLFRESGGLLAAQESEVDEVAWFPLSQIIEKLAYPDEKKLISRTNASEELQQL